MTTSPSATILVTGADGQLGREIFELATSRTAYRFIFANRSVLPIDQPDAVYNFFVRNNIQYCINCAAYTAVDQAESDPKTAFRVNELGPGNLAEVCKTFGAKFIHISTDYVYDGQQRKPLKEGDPTGPLNVYGQSKLQGERLAIDRNPESLVIRTSWVYSSFGHNFLKTMVKLLSTKQEIRVVSDQTGCPTYAADLAAVVLLFIDKMAGGSSFSGIYNFSNSGVTTWFDFAGLIKKITGSHCIIHPVTTDQYPTPAIRPLYSVLDTTKIRKALHIQPPFWEASVETCLRKI